MRRVFITDDFHDMMPKYLNFVRGVVSTVVCSYRLIASSHSEKYTLTAKQSHS